MSHRYIDLTTLSIGGDDEQDYEVRGFVDVEMTERGSQAFFDGTPEVHVGSEWVGIDDLDLTSDYRERVLDTLAACAMSDDSDDCVEDDDDDDEREYEFTEVWA